VPNNAVLLVLGDVKAEEGIALAKKHFGEIPAGAPPPFADPSEPEQAEERRGNVEEKFGRYPRWPLDTCESALIRCAGAADQALHGGPRGRIFSNVSNGHRG